jgi:hypothetical protein
MNPFAQLPPRARLPLVALAALCVLALLMPGCIGPLIGTQLRAQARARGYDAHWQRLTFAWPLRVELRGLAVTHTLTAAPFVNAERVEVSLGPRGFHLRPGIAQLVIEGARVTLPSGSGEEDSTALREDDLARSAGPASPRVRAAAEQLADALLLPARRLPELRISGLEMERGDSLLARLGTLTLTHRSGGVQFAAMGVIAGEHRVPFSAVLDWNAQDRLVGRATFHVPDATRGDAALELEVDGRVTQDRRAGVLKITEGTHVRLGSADLRVTGEVRRAGPRFLLALGVDGLTARGVQRSLPPAVLGPLTDLSCRGAWDWRASVDVNVAEPDSARFTADVIPHGLQLGPDGPRLRLGALAGPFVAEIHVPREGIVTRELSPANPHFRPLERISPLLQYALLTNEDGGFYHHRGFNTEAIQMAMAANLRSGTFKRGAGTITMQLARNLFLGHQRTLSRKAQEVVLAWVLEHLTGLPKERLLEIYLNIIEWGPGVHGADEAARFYFDEDAADLTLEQALFLTVVVPSPTHWKSRLDASGELRPWARAQMAYIAGKMVTRGWLAPEQVPDAESLRVRLRGAAAETFAPRDSASVLPGAVVHI